MPTIGLVGGNSQVATEVALFLSLRPDIQVVPICRSSIGAAFLRHCGLPSRVGTMNDPSAAREALAGLDAAVDFSLSPGAAGKCGAARSRASRIWCSGLRRYAAWFNTAMAFGIRAGDADAATISLRGPPMERPNATASIWFGGCSCATGRKPMCCAWARSMENCRASASRCVPSSVSSARFPCPTRSRTQCSRKHRRGPCEYRCRKGETQRLTLMSTPDWHWRDIYNYYCEETEKRPELHLYSCMPSRIPRKWLHSAQAAGKRVLLRHRESIGAYVLSRMPQTEGGVLAKYRLSNAARDIAATTAFPANPYCTPVVVLLPAAGLRA